MTAQLSREQLLADIAHAEEKASTLCGACAEDHARLAGYMRMLLAGMDSEPSGYLYRAHHHLVETPWRYTETLPDYVAGDGWQIRPQFDISAPPAPVADVPEAVREALDRVACPDAYMRVAVEACRAAMIQSFGNSEQLEPVSQRYTLSEEKGSSLQLRNLIRQRHAEWSDKTFGNVGPVGPLKHLAKEAIEASEALDDLSEWADMQFLLWDAQRRAGISDGEITAALEEKLKVNMARQWPEPKDGEPRLHVKPEQEV